MLAQTTDSASSNNTMAHELARMFQDAENEEVWDSTANQVKCYTHKIGLVVKAGLKSLGLSAGHVKPTTQPGVTLPTPTMTLNDGDEDIVFDSSESELEDNESHRGPAGGRIRDDNDSDCGSDYGEENPLSNVARAVRKVSLYFSPSLCSQSFFQLFPNSY